MQNKIDILADIIKQSALTPKKKSFALKMFNEIITSYGLCEMKMKQLILNKYCLKNYPIKKIEVNLDKIFIVLFAMGLDVDSIFSIDEDVLVWVSNNFPIKEQSKMTTGRLQELIRRVEFYRVINGSLPETMKDMIDYFKNNTEINV